MNGFIRRFCRHESGAVTVEWVVLSALAVTLLAAGFGSMETGTVSLADSTTAYMEGYR